MTTRIKFAGGSGSAFFREVRAKVGTVRLRSPILVLSVLLLTSACIGARGTPAYHWYSVRADFEVEGEAVSLGGVVECVRKGPDFFPYNFGSGPGNLFNVRNRAFAAKLATGGVLLMSPLTACSRWQGGLDDTFPEGYYPLVYWVDDPDRPSRAEVYFSDTYYAQKDARVRFKGFEAKRLGTGDWIWSRPGEFESQSSLLAEVPWLLEQEPKVFRGYVVTSADERLWGQIDGARESLAEYRAPTLIVWDSDLYGEEDRRRALEGLLCSGINHCVVRGRSTPYYGCRVIAEEVHELCGGLYRTYGTMPVDEVAGAVFSKEETLQGYTVLVPAESFYPGPSSYRFEINGRVFEGPLKSIGLRRWLMYLPASKELYHIQTVRLVARALLD
ncbi:MAG: hypothetical protein QNJ30_03255 [Kiloniellales bacterium]|nr:hypothetical protein [Kiloniellales bacterium]